MLAVALGVVLFGSLGGSGKALPVVGAPAPSFSLAALDGSGTVGVPADGGADGRPVVLLFFASWCPPCRAELPAIARVFRDQPARARVAIVGVDGMDSLAAARQFVRASGVTFPVAADTRYSVTEALYALTDEPDAVFIDGDGTIARIVHGPVTTSELLRWERALR